MACRLGAAVLALGLAVPGAAQTTFELLIRHGRVVDGSGGETFEADIGIRGGRIVRVGDDL